MLNVEEVARQIAIHEAVCAERWQHVSAPLGDIGTVLAPFVLLSVVGDGARGDMMDRVSDALCTDYPLPRCRPVNLHNSQSSATTTPVWPARSRLR